MVDPLKSLVIVSSFHHGNTERIAHAFAGILHARVVAPQRVEPEELKEYGLVGFGSGIDSGRHYRPLLDLVDALPHAPGAKAFLFSTCGAPVSLVGNRYIEGYAVESHAALREKLVSRGYVVCGEFSCAGFNTNSFLRLFGGLNRGRPDAADLGRAEGFARGLIGKARG